jgi:hypothetical protein
MHLLTALDNIAEDVQMAGEGEVAYQVTQAGAYFIVAIAL